MTDQVHTDRFRNLSGHPEDLEGGMFVEAGGFVDLTAEQQESETNKAKLEAGFIRVPTDEENQANAPEEATTDFDREAALVRAKELDITGASRMRNDVLKTAINEAEEKLSTGGEV